MYLDGPVNVQLGISAIAFLSFVAGSTLKQKLISRKIRPNTRLVFGRAEKFEGFEILTGSPLGPSSPIGPCRNKNQNRIYIVTRNPRVERDDIRFTVSSFGRVVAIASRLRHAPFAIQNLSQVYVQVYEYRYVQIRDTSTARFIVANYVYVHIYVCNSRDYCTKNRRLK